MCVCGIVYLCGYVCVRMYLYVGGCVCVFVCINFISKGVKVFGNKIKKERLEIIYILVVKG